MKNFYYSKNQELIAKLDYIENLRKELLLSSLSPRQELEVRWEGLIEQIYYSLMLNGTVIPKEKIAGLLTPQGKKILNAQEKLVVGFKMSLDYLYHQWLVSDKPITVEALRAILSFFEIQKIRTPESELLQILNYTQLNNEHPVIQAGLAYIFFYDLYQSNQEMKVFINIFYLLLLYKQGYDFRGMAVFERQFINDSLSYQVTLANATQQENVTLWLEYFAKVVIAELQENLRTINLIKHRKLSTNSTLDLNDRQKAILSTLNNPNLLMTNMQVQKLFNVSQITASRDLAKLTALGLLLTIGKGRSTQYAKI